MTPDKPKKQAFNRTGLPMEWMIPGGTTVTLFLDGSIGIREARRSKRQLAINMGDPLDEFFGTVALVAAEIERRAGGEA